MKKVLIIEDDSELRDLISICLQKKFEVCETSTVAEAKVLACEINFDVILSDVHVKDGSAVNLMTHLRSKGILTPIIVQSGDQNFEVIRSCMQLGVVDYVLKPWKFDDMIKKIDKILALEQKRKDLFKNTSDDKHNHKIFGLMQVSLKNSSGL